MKYYKKLQGQKVYLSPMNTCDYAKYTEWINDLNVAVRLGEVASMNLNEEGEKEALEKMAKEGYNFAIINKTDDCLIGNISLMNINQIHRTAEVGLFIGDAENRSKGYGSEAMELALCYGFKILNLNNILLNVFSFNKNAHAMYKKVGFKEIGRRRKSYFYNNQYYDVVFMDILSEEFKSDLLDKKIGIY